MSSSPDVLALLRSEIEKLVDPPVFAILSRIVLGREIPSAGDTSRAKLSASLVDACVAASAVEALVDVLAARYAGLDQRLLELRGEGYRSGDALRVGTTLGDYRLEARLGRGPVGVVFAARGGDDRVRLKVLDARATERRSALTRYLAAARGAAELGIPGLGAPVRSGEVGGRVLLSQALVQGRTLADRTVRVRRLRDAWPELRSVLEALKRLHAAGLVHGSLRAENVLAVDSSAPSVVLLDVGTHFLSSPRALLAPEQLVGDPSTPRTDVYAFGVLAYEMLTGQPVFKGDAALRIQATLGRQPEPASFVAPRGYVEDELDELLLETLDRDPGRRPPDAEALLDRLGALAVRVPRTPSMFPERELDEGVAALLERPEDEVLASVLESSVDRGADPRRAAEAFLLAAESLAEGSHGRRRLHTRAAALFETGVGDTAAAMQIYERLAAADPADESAWAGVERIHRRDGKYDALAESLVLRAEKTEPGELRARVFSTLGEVLRTKLDDPDQALIAFVRAFADAPVEVHAAEIEGLAGSRPGAWAEVLSILSEQVVTDGPSTQRNAILLQLGRWYAEHSGSVETAERCFQAILMAEPAHDAALAALAELALRARNWPDLARLLLRRADGPVDPELARTLRMDAAEVYEERLSDRAAALALYEQVAADEPSNARAADALLRIHTERGDARAFVHALQRAIGAAVEPRRTELSMRLAAALARTLDGAARAAALYEEALPHLADPSEALAGLERTYRQLGRFEDLRRVLEGAVERFTTAGQQVAALEKLAFVLSADLLDTSGAARVLERIVALQPTHAAAIAGLSNAYEKLGDWEALARLHEQRCAALPAGTARIEPLVALGAVCDERLHASARALAAYEAVLAIEPRHAVALSAAARLRAAAGDELGAARAHEALAGDAATPSRRAAELLAAGQLLEHQGDLAAAADRYRLAVEAQPASRAASAALRRTRIARGEIDGVVRTLETELVATDSADARVELGVELARLLLDVVRDPGRAEATAERVLRAEPGHLPALVIAGDAALAADHPGTAASYYGRVIPRLSQLGAQEAARISAAHARALGSSGDGSGAVATAETVIARFGGEREPVLDAARTIFAHGSPERSIELFGDLLQRFGATLSPSLRSELLYRRGEALRRAGRAEEAIPLLEEAAGLEPSALAPLRSARQAHAACARWNDVKTILERELARATPGERPDLLAEIGELLAGKLGDPRGAAARYLEALGERPGDRRLLLRLVQLYTAEHDWEQVVGAIQKLADVATEGEQRARQLLVAARVVLTELHDAPRSATLVDRALEGATPSAAVVREAVALYQEAAETERLRGLLERQIDIAARSNDRARAKELATTLADLHLSELHRDEAIAVYEAVARLGGADRELEDVLVDLYASDPPRYLDRAVALEERVIERDPHRIEPYRTLLALYTGVRNRDAAWCMCQALVTLGAAAPDEEAYFRKHRSTGEIPGEAHITEDDFQDLVAHPAADRTLSAIFAQIQPIIAQTRGLSLERAGCAADRAITVEGHSSILVGAFDRVSSLLRMRPPRLFVDPRNTAPIRMPRTTERCLLVGEQALRAEVPRREAVFVAGAHLACFRPGAYVRVVVSTVAGLKAWMLAAIRLVAPRLSVAPELEGPTNEAFQALKSGLSGAASEWIAEPVGELLRRGTPADVGKWVAGIDMTSDRLGFIACGDLPTAMAAIRAAGDHAAAVPVNERVRALVAYAASPSYLTLRERLRMTLDARELVVDV